MPGAALSVVGASIHWRLPLAGLYPEDFTLIFLFKPEAKSAFEHKQSAPRDHMPELFVLLPL